MTAECHFHAEILAPAGLAGIEGHLHLCKMGLAPYRSGFNGQLILRSQIGEERFEFDMDPSTTDTLHASGTIYLSEAEAWVLLQSLSTALSAAGFPHKIRMDDACGELFKRVDCNVPAKNHET
jgi:hypothetical protein